MSPGSSFRFQRRRLASSYSAPTSKTNAYSLDLQTSTDSGFAESTSGGANTNPLVIMELQPRLLGFGFRNNHSDLPDLLYPALSVAAAGAAQHTLHTGGIDGLPATV